MRNRPRRTRNTWLVGVAWPFEYGCLCFLLALSMLAGCSDSREPGGTAHGAAGGESARGGSSNAGGAVGEAGKAAAAGDSAGQRGATDPGGMGGTGDAGGAGEGGAGRAGGMGAASGAAGAGDAGEGGEAGEAGGVGCGNGRCEADEDCASCGSDCGACSCEYFFQDGTYPNIKALLTFQTYSDDFAIDLSYDRYKTVYALWAPGEFAFPNKEDFHAELCRAWNWLASADRFTKLDEPATSMSPNGGPGETELDQEPHYFIPLEDGWRLYLRWVAHNVALELRHELPWSLERLAATNPDAALALLDSTEMMHRRKEGDFRLGHVGWHYTNQPYSSSLGMTMIGMPHYTLRFLTQAGLLKDTERETVVALLEWARAHLVHFLGPANRESCLATWGHPYPPTVEMVIEGTNSIHSFQHWTMGCHGTSQFIKDVLRAVNIPARVPFMCSHALLWLPGLDLWMDHGDDPYHQGFKNSSCSADFLLVDRATFQAAFGTAMATVYEGGVCDARPVGQRLSPESIATCPGAL